MLYALGAGVVLLGIGGGYARLTGMGEAASASAGAAAGSSGSSKSDPKEAQKARELARSNEPYDSAQLQAFIDTLPPFTEDDPSQPMATRMQVWIKSLQTRICTAIEQVEAAPCHSTSLGKLVPVPKDRPAGVFLRDSWLRPEGGEGISCVLQEGRIFEKAGVNVSVVHGTLPPPAVKAMTADHEGKFKGWYDGKTPLPFKACGLSCVMHPHNPAAPTVHFNYRYFEVEDPKKPGVPKAWWFGGGSDLTPSYLFPVDAEHFHTSVAEECDSPEQYQRFKKWCDEYFRIKHRGESRGLGGIFFDDLSAAPGDTEGREKLFDFVKRSGEGFVKSYVPIVARRTQAEFSERMRQWQQLRRGRYVEFNLVYDRGTQFGLRTPGARIESILMSLPLTARWEYFAKLGTESGSEESKLLDVLRNPRDWATTGQA